MTRHACLLLLTLALSASVAAQDSGLKRHDTQAPVDIDAQSTELLDRDSKAIFAGDVHITQGDMKLDADTVTVFYTRPKAGGTLQIQRADAQNNVRLTTPTETASGRYGIYDVAGKTITLVGGVTLTRGESVLRGQRLSIDLDSGRSKLDGAGTAPTVGQPTGSRVTGRFVVPPRTSAK